MPHLSCDQTIARHASVCGSWCINSFAINFTANWVDAPEALDLQADTKANQVQVDSEVFWDGLA